MIKTVGPEPKPAQNTEPSPEPGPASKTPAEHADLDDQARAFRDMLQQKPKAADAACSGGPETRHSADSPFSPLQRPPHDSTGKPDVPSSSSSPNSEKPAPSLFQPDTQAASDPTKGALPAHPGPYQPGEAAPRTPDTAASLQAQAPATSPRPGEIAGAPRPSDPPLSGAIPESTPREIQRDAPKSDSDASPLTVGDAILRGMGADQVSRTEAPTQATRPNPDIPSLTREIVDRVLVSKNQLDGQGEVRIQVKENVLPDTEVRVTRQGDHVEIKLVTSTYDSQQNLLHHADSLEQHLKSKLGEGVRVNVALTDSQQEQGDGRSRQQRNLMDELQDQDE